jgi:hypothetical protein
MSKNRLKAPHTHIRISGVTIPDEDIKHIYSMFKYRYQEAEIDIEENSEFDDARASRFGRKHKIT